MLAFDGGTAALEGCSFSGHVSADSDDAAVFVASSTSSTARVQNCTFSGNGADVHVSSSDVLYTDTPVSALTLSADSDVDSIQPLADAPAGEFPTMASPAFVALRQVLPGRLPVAGWRSEPERVRRTPPSQDLLEHASVAGPVTAVGPLQVHVHSTLS